MNQFLMGLVVVLGFGSMAFARDLNCRGEFDSSKNESGFESISLTAEVDPNSKKNEVQIHGLSEVQVEAVSVEAGRVSTQVGRKDSLSKDPSYKPRKYVGSNRFDLRTLIDVKDFSDFTPGAYCGLEAIIPQDVLLNTPFEAVVMAHCEHSGSAFILVCEVQ